MRLVTWARKHPKMVIFVKLTAPTLRKICIVFYLISPRQSTAKYWLFIFFWQLLHIFRCKLSILNKVGNFVTVMYLHSFLKIRIRFGWEYDAYYVEPSKRESWFLEWFVECSTLFFVRITFLAESLLLIL